MYEEYPNPYKAGREYAKKTRVEAALALNISVDTLKSYEIDRLIPNGQMAVAMAKCYLAPWVAIKHGYRHDPIIQYVTTQQPKFFDSHAEATVNMCQTVKAVAMDRDNILDSICSKTGQVDVVAMASRLISASLSVLCASKEKAARATTRTT